VTTISHNGGVSDLIDTTEMYLRTIYELVEEGIVPLRARIAERLHQSGPTVSQTVARMERDGLLTVEGDRHLELTDEGHRLATRVMRKHRLAERLLTDVIGLPWELVHAEACRWEHVMSEDVERRLIELLGQPTESPYGNPIPGLGELGAVAGEEFMEGVESLASAVDREPQTVRVRIRRISEEVQKDEALMAALHRVGALPDRDVTASQGPEGVLVGSGGETAEIDPDLANHVFVRKLEAQRA
jgi:DtxR family Mn-dependent transcriptional regulator